MSVSLHDDPTFLNKTQFEYVIAEKRNSLQLGKIRFIYNYTVYCKSACAASNNGGVYIYECDVCAVYKRMAVYVL